MWYATVSLMDIEIKKTVRSTHLPLESLITWAVGQGENREIFRDPKFETNEYVQNFEGWTIGINENSPVFARIEMAGRVFIYELFSEKEDDWGLVQNWFFEQTGIQLGELHQTTQTVVVEVGVQVDLFATAEKIGVEFNPDEDMALVFLMESDLIDSENPQSAIILFASGKIMFTMLHGNIQLQEDKEKLLQMAQKIADNLIPLEQ